VTRPPGAHGLPHTTLAGGGHVLQEDAGPQSAEVMRTACVTTPRPRASGASQYPIVPRP